MWPARVAYGNFDPCLQMGYDEVATESPSQVLRTNTRVTSMVSLVCHVSSIAPKGLGRVSDRNVVVKNPLRRYPPFSWKPSPERISLLCYRLLQLPRPYESSPSRYATVVRTQKIDAASKKRNQ